MHEESKKRMKLIYLSIFIPLLHVTTNNAYSKPNHFKIINSPSTSAELFQEAYNRCRKGGKHEKLYNFGKKLASGWDYRRKDLNKAKNSFNHDIPTEKLMRLVRTKSQLMSVSLVFYEKKLDAELGPRKKAYGPYLETTKGCSSGLIDYAKSQPWSSVHSGLIDYLNPKDKAYFLSLPER